MQFKITSAYEPTGDQPGAIAELVKGVKSGSPYQTLLGVTGSGKTFTVANVIEQVQRPTLVLSHNKTLAAQLYSEFQAFFPDNAVEYFVSYYDYYQPEAYIATTDTYIEKDLSINQEIEKLRLSTTSSLLSGRRDIVVVSSVSCIYGIGNPEAFSQGVIRIRKGLVVSRNRFLHQLVNALYARTEAEFTRGHFRVKGDTVDVYPAYADFAIRVYFWGDEIEDIETFEASTGIVLEKFDSIQIYPANLFVTSQDSMKTAIYQIQEDMVKQVEYFDGRATGSRPFCLLDYFPEDFLMVIDESHVTVPQIRAMYGGDRSRKEALVEHGFRLPAAMDNRPLKFDEFETLMKQLLFVSATPAEYELQKSEGVVVEQVIRPTGLLDPIIEVKPSKNQVDDLLEEIKLVVERDERVLVTTLTKRMAEELTKYMTNLGIRCRYIHSDVDTLERVEIMQDLRNGLFDVLVGINLLREGLDLPEVSLVAILDADKEGFLRSERSLVQTVGRAARNVNGRVIMYGDKITDSMRKTIDETNRRRKKQIQYNFDHDLQPRQIIKDKNALSVVIEKTRGKQDKSSGKAYYEMDEHVSIAAEPIYQSMNATQLEKAIQVAKKSMEKAAKELDFVEAARFRDEMLQLQALLVQKKA
jgi:excinuclease ABC subunit B